MMTYITRQLPTKPTTNTMEYTAAMMVMMGDMKSGSASHVSLAVRLNNISSEKSGCQVKLGPHSSGRPATERHLSSLKMCTTSLSMVMVVLEV